MSEEHHSHYRTLYQVARLINSSLDPDEVLNAIVEQTAKAMNAKGRRDQSGISAGCQDRPARHPGRLRRPAGQLRLPGQLALVHH